MSSQPKSHQPTVLREIYTDYIGKVVHRKKDRWFVRFNCRNGTFILQDRLSSNALKKLLKKDGMKGFTMGPLQSVYFNTEEDAVIAYLRYSEGYTLVY